MKSHHLFLLSIFFLASCSPSTPAPTATPVPTSTLTPIPTATSTPEAWVAIVEEYGMPADLPAGAYFSKDGTKILSADREELYVLEKNEQGGTRWVEAMMPLSEMSPWVNDYWQEANELLADEIASGEVKITRGVETDVMGEWEYFEVTREAPSSEELVQISEGRLVTVKADSFNRIKIAGELDGSYKVRKVKKLAPGMEEYLKNLDNPEDGIEVSSTISFLNRGEGRDGGERKLEFKIRSFEDWSQDETIGRLQINEGLPTLSSLEELFAIGSYNSYVDFVTIDSSQITSLDGDLLELEQGLLDEREHYLLSIKSNWQEGNDK